MFNLCSSKSRFSARRGLSNQRQFSVKSRFSVQHRFSVTHKFSRINTQISIGNVANEVSSWFSLEEAESNCLFFLFLFYEQSFRPDVNFRTKLDFRSNVDFPLIFPPFRLRWLRVKFNLGFFRGCRIQVFNFCSFLFF